MSASIVTIVRPGIPIPQHLGDGIHFLLPDESPPADVSDDVLGTQDVIVDQRKAANARHDELERDAGSARAASGHQDSDIREERNVEEGFDSLKSPVVHRASVLSGHSPVLRHSA